MVTIEFIWMTQKRMYISSKVKQKIRFVFKVNNNKIKFIIMMVYFCSVKEKRPPHEFCWLDLKNKSLLVSLDVKQVRMIVRQCLVCLQSLSKKVH